MKKFEDLLGMKPSRNKGLNMSINQSYKAFEHDDKNVSMFDFKNFVVLANSMMNLHNNSNQCHVYISAHGRVVTGEINIYNRKVFYYGPNQRTLSGEPIREYISCQAYGPATVKPLAHIHKGFVHPYTVEALNKLKKGEVDPSYFTGVNGSLAYMSEHELTRYEKKADSIIGFRTTIHENDRAVIVMLKNRTKLSDVLHELDKCFGNFNSYSLSFCRGTIWTYIKRVFNKIDYSHQVSSNDVDRLSTVGYNNLSNIQLSVLKESMINHNPVSSIDNIHARLIKWLTYDLHEEITARLKMYENRDLDYAKKFLTFRGGYSRKDKIEALTSLKDGLLLDYNKRKFVLSPRVKSVLFNGTLGNSLKLIAMNRMIKSRTEMLNLLGFHVR